jgi:hypothetical protein|tara:strand:- start:4090 stop:4263 length:174 start_codon:yes stop_codon:yes gene_type:complete
MSSSGNSLAASSNTALAFSMPPPFARRSDKALSTRGLYGDVIEKIDWSVAQVLDTAT